ncbi:uncharacterized protein F4807DRAFT_44407 [Annulohypoxylon truncatum]|uniref:uncharacterized protein n=1 Tax=Annulohypoxylon truncatum TaxID=327061 RepID=UPI002008DBD5|nr:uncharacterized protein F4807DRAFT_44407 [Annulohypoxylon truncatum]KAI1210955.1 hypothetical protein F4807DRAFT_44407 [Annulohypoxylon truncatum]
MSKHAWKIELIPWDPSSPEHVQRMYDQRIACGWRANEVPQWVDAAKKGEKIFYWAVFSDTVPDREALIKKHIEAYPKESTPLRETAAEVRLVPRQPTMAEFTPIGHVAIAIHEPEEDVKLGLLPTGTVWIHGLYISRALHGGGFGAGTMSKTEEIASQSPMNAKIVALDTLSKETQTEPETREILYGNGRVPEPKFPTEDWYVRLGYEVFRRGDHLFVTLANGNESMPINVVYMRKLVV